MLRGGNWKGNGNWAETIIIKLVKHRRALLADANTNGNDVCHYFNEAQK